MVLQQEPNRGRTPGKDMTKELKETHFDTRIIERNLKTGALSQKDYDAYLKNLPNEEDNFELTTFEDDDLTLDADYSEFEVEESAEAEPSSEPELS